MFKSVCLQIDGTVQKHIATR